MENTMDIKRLLKDIAPLVDDTFPSSTWKESGLIRSVPVGICGFKRVSPPTIPEGHVEIRGCWAEDGSAYSFYVPSQLAPAFCAMQQLCRNLAQEERKKQHDRHHINNFWRSVLGY